MKKLLLIISLFISAIYSAQTPQSYTSFKGSVYNLYKWEGDKVMLLSKSNALDAATMNKLVRTMDSIYYFYTSCTGATPIPNAGVTYINGRTTLAEVDSTCGAGCGYLGWTGIELLSP